MRTLTHTVTYRSANDGLQKEKTLAKEINEYLETEKFLEVMKHEKLNWEEANTLAEQGCVVIRHGPSIANVMQENKEIKDFRWDPFLYYPDNLPFYLPEEVFAILKKEIEKGKISIATSQLIRTKQTAILLVKKTLAKFPELKNLKKCKLHIYPYSELNEISNNWFLSLLGILGFDNRPAWGPFGCNVNDKLKTLEEDNFEVILHDDNDQFHWYEHPFAVSSGEKMRSLLIDEQQNIEKLNKIMGNYAVFQHHLSSRLLSKEHPLKLRIVSTGIPKKVISEYSKDLLPNAKILQSNCKIQDLW